MKESRRIVYLILALAMVLSGCGGEVPAGESAEILLLDPVDAPAGWEMAACRTLYDAKLYPATVFPRTEEYSFDKNVVLDRFCVYPGESVKKGGVLAYADNTALEESIRQKEEQILQMEKDFQEYRKETEEALYEPQLEAEHLLQIVENLEKQKPEEYLTVSGGTSGGDAIPEGSGTKGDGTGEETGENAEAGKQEKNPAYLQWEEMYHRYEGDYRILAHSVDTTRVQLEQRTQLYELDHEHALKQLERMKDEVKRGVLLSSMEGQVVAMTDRGSGSYISEKDNVIAIGDMGQKLLKCKYINKITAAKAKDMYALIDGRRYEVIYQPMDSEEYNRLSALNETIYTTFELEEDAEDVAVGDFAVIIVVNDSRENVLSVPQSAIHKDADGSFVYLRQGEESVAVNVVTGMSDGVYTEILSGIEGGDWVLAEEAVTPGEQRAVVGKGSFHSSFSGTGYLMYPSTSKVRNPVTYGTVYFTEYKKGLYEHVEKGEVIATIRVQQDEVALKRNQVKLERLQERLALLEQGEDKVSEKTLAAKREEIAKVQELIHEMQADYATTEIRAEQSGIIIDIHSYRAEDILGTGAEFVEIADESTCYVVLENRNQLLQYGNKVTVSYTNKEGETGITSGMVANLTEAGVGSSLKPEYALILLPSEAIKDMAAAKPDRNGWMVRNSFKVEADVREMDNVVVVPKGAVWEAEGQTYVFVAEEDGSVAAHSFIAGGYNSSYYWVADGLTEGMEVCLK